MTEKGPKGRFFSPDKPENHTSKGKGKNKKKERGGRKEEKGKKTKFALYVIFIILATLDEKKQKKLLDEIGLFGGIKSFPKSG